MVLRFLAAVGLAGVVWLSPGRALAAEAVIELERPAVATCVSEEELRKALERAGLGVAGSSSPPSERVALRVEGTPEELTVVVRRAGVESSERLAKATCETATDAVAALVVSAVAPAPVVDASTNAPPPLDEAAVEKAVGDELARRGVSLAMLGLRLHVERDASGTWFARIESRAVATCHETLPIGRFELFSMPRTRSIADLVLPVVERQRACSPVSPRDDFRRFALDRALDEVEARTYTMSVVAGFEILTGGLMLTGLAAIDSPNVGLGFSTRLDALATVSSGLHVVGGATALLVHEDYRSPVVESTFIAGTGGFTTAVLLTSSKGPTYAYASALAGPLGTSTLIALGAALRRPPVERLRRARTTLREDGFVQNIDETERDLLALPGPFPRIVTYAPLIVGGLVTAYPGTIHGFDDDDELPLVGVGYAYVAIGTLLAVFPNPTQRYQSSVTIVELWLAPGPGDFGLSVEGTF